jgi:hypothetical protein
VRKSDDAALSNFENASACYARAGLGHEWSALVAEVRAVHRRKIGFMPGSGPPTSSGRFPYPGTT